MDIVWSISVRQIKCSTGIDAFRRAHTHALHRNQTPVQVLQTATTQIDRKDVGRITTVQVATKSTTFVRKDTCSMEPNAQKRHGEASAARIQFVQGSRMGIMQT